MKKYFIYYAKDNKNTFCIAERNVYPNGDLVKFGHKRIIASTFTLESAEKILKVFNTELTHLPTTSNCAKYLKLAEEKFGITKDEARDKYGLFTTREWVKLLN